jgi:hypothetical protein
MANVVPIQCLAFSPPSTTNHEFEVDDPLQSADLVVELRQNLLTITAYNVRLETILADISKKTGISIFLCGSAETLVSARISDRPVEEAIKRLTRGSNHAFIYARNDSGTPLYSPTTVFIYAESADSDAVFGGPAAAASESTSDSFISDSEDPAGAFETLKERTFEENEEAISQMIAVALRDEKEETRGEAIEVLGSIGEERVMDALIQALYDDQSWVRAASVRAIGEHGGQRALNALEVALRDPVPEVAEAARHIMDEMVAGEQEEEQNRES